jgi:predicted dehydrogenase
MKIIFFGLGSIGQRHARLLLKHFDHKVYAFRSGAAPKQNALNIPELYSWEDVASLSPDVAFIANPTDLHLRTAIACAKLGMNLFIEKPIDRTCEGLDELMGIVEQKGLSTYVAYCLRFHPVIKELNEFLADKSSPHVRAVVSSHLPDWRPGLDYRANYSADEKRGGGVVLELSHEVDYCTHFLGKPITIGGQFGKSSALEVKCEDFADLVMKCEKGICNLHMNFFSRKPERYVHIDLPNSDFITGDLIKNTVTKNVGRRETVNEFKFERDDMFVEQLKHFFNNIGRPRMMNDLIEAGTMFRKLVEFKEKHGKQ